MQDFLTWAFGIVGLVGLVATFYYGRRSNALEKKLQGIEIEWKDIPAAAKDIAKAVIENFRPDIMFSPDVRGGIVAYYIGTEIGHIPSVIGICEYKATDTPIRVDLGYGKIETSNWRVYIPTGIDRQSDIKILIVDDFVMSGDALAAMRAHLVDSGLRPENIRTAALATTRVALHNRKGPDYYWKIADSSRFFLPWGLAR